MGAVGIVGNQSAMIVLFQFLLKHHSNKRERSACAVSGVRLRVVKSKKALCP